MKKVDKYYTMYIGYTELTRRYTHKAFNIQETTFIFFVVCCSWHNYLWLLLQERWCTVCYRDLPKNKRMSLVYTKTTKNVISNTTSISEWYNLLCTRCVPPFLMYNCLFRKSVFLCCMFTYYYLTIWERSWALLNTCIQHVRVLLKVSTRSRTRVFT